MGLVEQVSSDLKAAMLAKDTVRTGGLRMIRAAFIELDKEGKGPVTDERCIERLKTMKKQRIDSIDSYVKGGREDLAEVERAELAIIEGFLPKVADEAQTLVWVQEAVAASGATTAKEMGKVMGLLMKAHKDDVDAGLARALITKALGG